MGEVILRLNLELEYEPGQGLEIHLRHGGSLTHEVGQHLARAGKEMSLALQHLAQQPERAPEKVRTKIEIEEA
ncbi:MAG: hypothetical protein DRI01_09245 [Chloroflexi bacterium]|nr:MAG: hypothetical protein DRI01_09245 [Chloroflexota bacterium]